MRLEIAQLHESLTTTMIYVTHDQIEAMTLADKIVVLNSGNIEQAGSPLELYHHPVNLFVAGFIGSPKMNFFATEVRATGADGVSVISAGRQGHHGSRIRRQPPAGRQGDARRPAGASACPRQTGEIVGQVAVAERLGGETYLYIRVAGQPLVVAQAAGNDTTARP